MTGCLSRCTSFSTDSIADAWTDIRYHFGPRAATLGSDKYTTDILEWTTWAIAHSIDPVTNVQKFGEWLIWKCSYGTTNNGNLPSRVRDHEGISAIPCPYDDDSSAVRTRLWLGLDETDPLPTQSDHGVYYMKVASRGSIWGFECTYDGCLYKAEYGKPYFHV